MKALVFIIIVIFAAIFLTEAGENLISIGPQPQTCTNPYIALPGDTLVSIGKLCGVTYDNMLAANPQITNPLVIAPNQVINIPNGVTRNSSTAQSAILNGGTGGGLTGSSSTAETVTFSSDEELETDSSTYVVKPGDTLYDIAIWYGISLNRLIQANPQIANPNLIYPGQLINLPEEEEENVSVSITPTTGTIGTPVTLSAAGFIPNTPVVVSFGEVGETFYRLDTPTTDANGALNKQYLIPNTSGVVPHDGPYAFHVGLANDPDDGGFSNPIILSGVAAVAPSPGVPTGVVYITISPTVAHAGDVIQVTAGNFPPNAQVDVRIARQDQAYFALVDSSSDAQGVVSVQINVPSSALVGEQWVVTVTTTQLVNGVQITSLPITIN